MSAYSVADAKNTLPKLIDRALEGEEVIITRHGRPVVEIRPVSARPIPSTGIYEWLRARRHPAVGYTSVQLIDLMYETDEP